jgi:hypothetical protein
MKGLNKLWLAALLTGAAVGLGVEKARAKFPSQNPIVAEYNQYDWHVLNIKAELIADSLENKVIPNLRAQLQTLQDKHPDLTFICSILFPSGGALDRIGEQRDALGGTTSPTTAITWISDILDIHTSGRVQGVKLKTEYREISKEIFGEQKTAELETALSTLFSNNVDACRVVYSGPDSLGVRSVFEPSPIPNWLNSLDGKYAYMLIKIIERANGITPQEAGGYKQAYDQLYREILGVVYKLECANRAAALAKWLDENANNPDIPNAEKDNRATELIGLLKILGTWYDI